MYDTYLFDFDGTLVDSMPSYISVMLRILDENNVKYEDDIVKIITPLGYAGTAKYFKDMGVPLSVEEMIDKIFYSPMGRAMETDLPHRDAFAIQMFRICTHQTLI